MKNKFLVTTFSALIIVFFVSNTNCMQFNCIRFKSNTGNSEVAFWGKEYFEYRNRVAIGFDLRNQAYLYLMDSREIGGNRFYKYCPSQSPKLINFGFEPQEAKFSAHEKFAVIANNSGEIFNFLVLDLNFPFGFIIVNASCLSNNVAVVGMANNHFRVKAENDKAFTVEILGHYNSSYIPLLHVHLPDCKIEWFMD